MPTRRSQTIAVIEAANAEEEALAIAVALREAMETPGKTAALVTPDRALARRVLAALARWNVPVDDSGGDALADTPAGVFARLAAEAALNGLAPVTLLALLKHPLCRLRRARGRRAGARGAARAAAEAPAPRDWRRRSTTSATTGTLTRKLHRCIDSDAKAHHANGSSTRRPTLVAQLEPGARAAGESAAAAAGALPPSPSVMPR